MSTIIKNSLMQAVLGCLNSALKADPAAIHALVCNRVPCNQKLVDHPHVVVGLSQATGTHDVGAIGLLNGVLTSVGLDRIAQNWEETAEKWPDGKPKLRFTGFVVAGAESQPETSVDPAAAIISEERQRVDALVEESKNDNTIIVGSDIRFLAMIIKRQEQTIAQLTTAGSLQAQVIEETAKELGCENDNEEILKAIARNKQVWVVEAVKPKFCEAPGSGSGWSVWVVGYDERQKTNDGPSLKIVSWSHELCRWHDTSNNITRVTHWRYFTAAERDLIK